MADVAMIPSGKSLGFYTEPTLNAAKGLDVFNIPTDSYYARCQANGGAIRWRDDGTAPTTSTGHIIANGDAIIVGKGSFGRIQFVKNAAESPVLDVTFYKKA